jgi:hypothetical protein
MTIAYKAKNLMVVEVECPDGMKYPEKDGDGDTIYINSHFAAEEEAYTAAIENCDIGIRVAASSIEALRKDIDKQKKSMTVYAIAKNRLLKEAANQNPIQEQGGRYSPVNPHPVKMPIGCALPREDGFGPEDEESIPYVPTGRSSTDQMILDAVIEAQFAVQKVVSDPVALALMKRLIEQGAA